MIVRKANEQDTARIAEIERAVFSDAWSESGILEEMNQKTGEIYVAVENDIVIGYVIAYTVLDEGDILRVAVCPEFRRRGVARTLLNAVISEGAAHGIILWHLEVRESNTAALSLYRAYGFLKDGSRKDFYENPKENAILMSLSMEILSGVQESRERL